MNESSQENVVYEFTDRYGGRHPSFLRICRGQCEGMGWVPIEHGETEEPWWSLWLESEQKKPSDDGWHFVKCPECRGSGRVHWLRSIVRIPLWIWRASIQAWRFTADPTYRCGNQTIWQQFTTALRICFWFDIARLRN